MKVKLKKMRPELVSEEYLSWFKDPDIRRYIKFSAEPPTMHTLLEYVQLKQKDAIFYGIFCEENNVHIGNMKSEFVGDLLVDFGILIGSRKYRNKGIFKQIFPYFEKILSSRGAQKVFLGVHKDNLMAIKSYEAVGFMRDLDMDDKVDRGAISYSKLIPLR